MLASNSSRNSQPELIADDGQGMFFPACARTLAAARPESGTRPRGKKQERHIGPIDSDMPEKTHSEGALIFHTATAAGGEAVIDREFSKSTGER